jgi:hypothetical protein
MGEELGGGESDEGLAGVGLMWWQHALRSYVVSSEGPDPTHHGASKSSSDFSTRDLSSLFPREVWRSLFRF